MKSINEIVRKIERVFGIKERELNKIINTEIIPQLREELIEDYEAEAEELMEQLAMYQLNDSHLFGGHNCTDPERKMCSIEFRRMTILSLIAQGWITDKNIMKSDFWEGKPITKRRRGGSTVHL